MDIQHGIRANLAQFVHQLAPVLPVGLTLGTMRTVVPALSESEFNVPKGSFVLLVAFEAQFRSCRAVRLDVSEQPDLARAAAHLVLFRMRGLGEGRQFAPELDHVAIAVVPLVEQGEV